MIIDRRLNLSEEKEMGNCFSDDDDEEYVRARGLLLEIIEKENVCWT